MVKMRGLTLLLMLVLLSANLHAQPAAPEPILTLGRGEIVSAAWAPDGQNIWIGTTAGTWQLDTDLREIAAYPHITYAALSPDGTKLAGFSKDGFLVVWNTLDGQEHWRTNHTVFEPPTVPVWSPDSDHFVANVYYVQGRPPMGTIFALTQQLNNSFTYGEAKYTTWSASGEYVAAYEPYMQQVIVRRANGEAVQLENANRLEDLTPNGETTYLNWRGDFELSYSSIGDGSVRKSWSIPDGGPAANGSSCGGYGGCTFSPDGRYVAMAHGGSFTLSITNLDEQTSIPEYQTELGYPSQPTWRPDSKRVSAIISTWPRNEMKGIVVLDPSGTVIWERYDIDILPRELLWSPDGTQLFAYDVGGQMAIIDAETSDTVVESDTLYDATLVSFDPTSEIIAVASAGGSVYLAHSTTGTTIDRLLRSGPTVGQILWQPKRDQRAATSVLAIRDRYKYIPAGPVSIWTTFAEREMRVIPGTEVERWFGSGARSIAWKPDGTALAIGMTNGIKLWLGEELTELPLPGRIANYSFDRPVVDFVWFHDQRFPVAVLLTSCGHCEQPLFPDVPGALYDYNTDSDFGGMPGGWGTSFDGGFVLLQRQVSPSGISSPSDFLTITNTASELKVVLQGSNNPKLGRGWISPLATQVAAIDDSGSGLIWDATTGQPLDFLADVHDLVWTPNDSTLGILRRDGSLWLQNADGLRLLWSPTIPIRAPGSLVWSGDGSTLAHVQDGVLRVWKP